MAYRLMVKRIPGNVGVGFFRPSVENVANNY